MLMPGKQDILTPILRKLQANGPFAAGELDGLLVQLSAHPGFEFGRYTWLMSHPNPKVRECAGRIVLSKRDPRLGEQLVREIVGKPQPIRSEICAVVAQITPAEALLRPLSALVSSSKPEQRQVAVELMDRYERWLDFMGNLKILLSDKVTEIRHAAVSILAKGVRSPTIFMMLRHLINDQDARVRQVIIEAMAQSPSPEIVEPFFERLLEEGPAERSVMIRALSLLAKSALTASKIEERLMPMLADESPTVRETAVKLLSEIPDQTRVVRSLLVHCRGLAHWLRERSLETMLKAHRGIIVPLLSLMDDPDETVRVEAMTLAGSLRDPAVIPKATEVFTGAGDWWIRGIAAEILGMFPESAPTLLSKLDDPDLRHTVIHVLGKQAHPESLPALLGCVADPKAGIRLAVIDALAHFKAQETLQALSQLALNDPDGKVRAKAGNALIHFGAKSAVVRKKLEERDDAPPPPPPPEELKLEMVNEELN